MEFRSSSPFSEENSIRDFWAPLDVRGKGKIKMDYYSAKDIMKKTGYKESKVYEVIRNLNKELEIEYPNVLRFNAKIPVWYWNEKTGSPKENKNETTI